jgi:phosphoribosylaminoimidazole-succinocarboxamide synthase
MKQSISTIELPGIPLAFKGKVRDIFAVQAPGGEVGLDALLMVATDRLSAFDVVLPDPIPDKGRVLTGLSTFWFQKTSHILANHMITANVGEFPPQLHKHAKLLAGRSMLVKRAKPLPVECVVRGYLAGSGWRDYREKGGIEDVRLPPGLRESDRLPFPVFTPATKAATGHDENISQKEVEEMIGSEPARRVKEASLALYRFAADYGLSRGIIIADTKFELGLMGEELVLIDEVLTPDSSRFWDAEIWTPGEPQPSFDKQFVRDYLEAISWDKRPPAPDLPSGVIRKTASKYREAFRRITGKRLPPQPNLTWRFP